MPTPRRFIAPPLANLTTSNEEDDDPTRKPSPVVTRTLTDDEKRRYGIMPPRVYTDLEREAARELFAEGHTDHAIADELGIPYGTIYHWHARWAQEGGKVGNRLPPQTPPEPKAVIPHSDKPLGDAAPAAPSAPERTEAPEDAALRCGLCGLRLASKGELLAHIGLEHPVADTAHVTVGAHTLLKAVDATTAPESQEEAPVPEAPPVMLSSEPGPVAVDTTQETAQESGDERALTKAPEAAISDRSLRDTAWRMFTDGRSDGYVMSALGLNVERAKQWREDWLQSTGTPSPEPQEAERTPDGYDAPSIVECPLCHQWTGAPRAVAEHMRRTHIKARPHYGPGADTDRRDDARDLAAMSADALRELHLAAIYAARGFVRQAMGAGTVEDATRWMDLADRVTGISRKARETAEHEEKEGA